MNYEADMPKNTAMTFWQDPELFIAMALFVSVLFAKHLTGGEPLDPKRLAGEVILSCIGAAVFHAMGLLQGLIGPEYWLMMFLAALGGVRSVEWAMKILIAIKKVSA